MSRNIPKKVLDEIERRAKERWQNSWPERIECDISSEKEAYIEFYDINYSEISLKEKKEILNNVKNFESWSEKVYYIQDEIESIKEIREISKTYKNNKEFNIIKKNAVSSYKGSFFEQKEYILEKIKVMNIRKDVDPIKNILIDMEKIIGNSCYNANIQNYIRWGELESEGREFRYPVTFYINGEQEKRWSVSEKINAEDLLTGYYAFGANRLSVYNALYKILKYLEKNYGLSLPNK
ncbi:hypothetical protein [uncultured Mailhella sp.]|uniref:hypothetical protein n=1 Tax=uncultured Mailhella sp. TaxID=1981031 RepID=UPI0025D99F1C|nr:hypothetical protein [uncultured Mailhella sp.]